MHPHIVELMAHENQRRMSEEIQQLHMIGQIQKSRPGFNSRLLLALGDFLIQIGERMKQGNAPFTPTALDAH